MKSPSNTDFITGIRNHDSSVLNYVYNHHYPIVEGYIIHNQGSRDEARDIFQDAMMVVYKKIRSGELELTCKFGTYLYSICKNMWIQERKKYLQRAEKMRQQPMVVNDPDPGEDPLLKKHLSDLLNKHFAELSSDCQKILSMYFNHFSVEDIRAALNYKDLHHTADRKYRCKKSLMKRIAKDPLFKRLEDELR